MGVRAGFAFAGRETAFSANVALEHKSTFLYLATAVFTQYGAAITMEEVHRMRKSEQTEGTTELIVYSCHHVERGPELHIFDEEDIQAEVAFTASKWDCSAIAIGLPAWAR